MSTNELSIRLRGIAERVKQTVNTDLPRIAGKVAVDFFKQSFHNEGFTDAALQKWPEVKRRQNPRVRGARATRKILTGDTGDLGESITYHVRTPSEVVLKAEAYSKSGFNYAPVHNFGVTDTLEDNKYIEFKEVKRGKKRRRNIIDAIAKALKKSDIVYLKIEGEIKTEQVNLIGSKEIKKYPHKKIYLIDNEDNIYTFSSP